MRLAGLLLALVALLAAGCLGSPAPPAVEQTPPAWSPSGLPEPAWSFEVPPRPDVGHRYNHSAGGWQRGPDLPGEWKVASGHGAGLYQLILLPTLGSSSPMGWADDLACGQAQPRTAIDVGNHALWTDQDPNAFPLGNASAIVVRPNVLFSQAASLYGYPMPPGCPVFLVGNGAAVHANGTTTASGFELLEDGRIRLDDGLELAAGQTAQWWGPCPDDRPFDGLERSDCALIETVLHLGGWEASRVWFGASYPPSPFA